VSTAEALLPDAVGTRFGAIEQTMVGLLAGDRLPSPALRALPSTATATVVAVGPRERLVDAATALRPHAQTGAIRAILIAVGARSTPEVRVTASEILLDGLRTDYVNNAVAALRLPSLPALLWWRGGDPDRAVSLARLADRLVLDADDPAPLWARLDALAREAPVSDLRWTALTRWRSLMAHFFDLPGVPEAAASFDRLHVSGSDAHSARLFAGWLAASLKRTPADTRFVTGAQGPIAAASFGGGSDELRLARRGASCVEGHARIGGRETSRIASLGDQALSALIAEELRVRPRDLAFESAVRAAGAFS
jgi:Glucose-6-phosphate dehydrogenase subunit